MPAPDDLYRHDVDFTALALQYPAFAKRLKPNRQVDFSDPESVRQLTKSLLRRDFDLDIDLPDDRLCPPVPNRFNYVLFVRRLLDSTSPNFRQGHDPQRPVLGLDIGTGCSAIYPLLACRQHPSWRFLATDIDDKNRAYAWKNVTTNGLQERIRLVDTDPTGRALIPTAEMARFDRVDILMTNPPFYASEESMRESSRLKSRPPMSSCTGAAVEMITDGGEVGFVSRLIAESVSPVNRATIQWFSTMLGKLSSVAAVVDVLRAQKCTNYAVTEFVQGQKTRRWCVAWSWMTYRPDSAVARGAGPGVEKRLLPTSTEVEFDAAGEEDKVVATLNREMTKLPALWQYSPSTKVGMVMSRDGDVWSRKARRKQRQQEMGPSSLRHSPNGQGQNHKDEDTEMVDSHPRDPDVEVHGTQDPALVARITLTGGGLTPAGPKGRDRIHDGVGTRVHVRHLQGHDSVLFESFCGWLKTKLS